MKFVLQGMLRNNASLGLQLPREGLHLASACQQCVFLSSGIPRSDGAGQVWGLHSSRQKILVINFRSWALLLS